MTTPKTEERKTAIEQVRTPLLAALGAGNLAGHAVADAVGKARVNVTKSTEVVRKNVQELPQEVRGKLDPAELRKAIDEYTEAALKLYNKLAESGEEAWDRIAAQPPVKNAIVSSEQAWEKVTSQPQVKKAIEQLEEALATAQDRVEDVVGEARERVEDVLAKVTKRTRTAGEKAADKVSAKSGDLAEAVEETGDEAAQATRTATRKVTAKTAPAKTTSPARRTTTSPAAKKPAAPKTDK
jgi:heparin binding hemagglutinin HbhA